MTTEIICSWCHEANTFGETRCFNCGHNPAASHALCQCVTCEALRARSAHLGAVARIKHNHLPVLNEIGRERDRQDQKYGPGADDSKSLPELMHLIDVRLASSRFMNTFEGLELTRKRLIEVAALAVAVVESIDRRVQP